MLEEFRDFLINESKSSNSIKNYMLHVNEYLKWFKESFDMDFKQLYRKNVLEFKSYLKTIKNNGAKTINVKLSSLIKFNEFLQEKSIQDNIVVSKKDFIKVQENIARPGKVEPKEIDKFIQEVLENESKRNFAMVMLMAYGGLRISEVINIKLKDICLIEGSAEVVITEGKGDKVRRVPLNNKVVDSIKIYIEERSKSKYKDLEYLFVSNKGNQVNRTGINKIFKKYSDTITPHELRHFFCTHALEKGFGIHEVATIAGHSNIHTTLRYTNPSTQQLHDKMNLL